MAGLRSAATADDIIDLSASWDPAGAVAARNWRTWPIIRTRTYATPSKAC